MRVLRSDPDFLDDGVCHLGGGSGAPQVVGNNFALLNHFSRCLEDFIGCFFLPDVSEHQDAGKNDRRGIDLILSRIFRGTPVNGFKDCTIIAHVRSGSNAQPTNEARAQIGKDIAVQIGQKGRRQC